MRKIRIIPVLIIIFLMTAVCVITGCGSSSPEGSADTGQNDTGIWLLCEHEDVTVEFIETLNADSGILNHFIRVRSPERDNYEIQLTDLRLNGDIMVGEDYNVFEDDGGQLIYIDTILPRSLAVLPQNEDVRFSCHISEVSWGEDWQDEEVLWEQDAEIVIPAGHRSKVVLEPIFGVEVKEQVLVDDERLCVTLLGMGSPVNTLDDHSLYCFLKVENRSDEILPFRISGISLNGAFFNPYQNACDIEPGTIFYASTYVWDNYIDESGITSVSDISLLLLTDINENTGFFNADGGSWYPVELEGAAEQTEAPEIVDPIFENEWVRVGLAGCSEPLDSYDDETVYYHWNLLVQNKSDTNLELEADNPEDAEIFPWISNNAVGAGGWRYMTVSAAIPAGTECPPIDIYLRGVTTGGGSLLFLEKEPVTLIYEPLE